MKQLESGGKMRPPLGPAKKFDDECEAEMVVYCQFCWEIGTPRTQQRFAHELVHFMEYTGKRVDFPNTEPGYF